MANKKYIVNHERQYFRINGKMARVEKGAEVTLDEKAAEKMLKSKKLLTPTTAKSVVAGDPPKK